MKRRIFLTVDENFNFLNGIWQEGISLVTKKYTIFENKVEIGVAFIESISDIKLISSKIIEPLLKGTVDLKLPLEDILMAIGSKLIYIPNIETIDNLEQVIDGILNGDTVLFVNQQTSALIISSHQFEKRPIEKPTNEMTVSASMDSFIEDLNTNCSLVIKRLPTTKLQFETFTVGSLSHTKVKLLWVKGIENTSAVTEARYRIEKINVDIVDGIGVLAELIEDKPLTLFPKYKQTERPDMAAKYLADGHFVILCSNSPFAFIAPINLADNFKTMDDYAEKSMVSSFLRAVRCLAFIIAIFASPLYLAFVSYNHSIVPPALALNIASGRAVVPFPSFVELIFMNIFISIIREAALRLPGSIGLFVGTLAAIVMGQAAVSAGYVSASLIIIVALSAISAYAVSYSPMIYAAKLLNYMFILLAGTLGMFGIINGMILLLLHLVSLNSFGEPYLSPLVPFDAENMKDSFIRFPASFMKKNKK